MSRALFFSVPAHGHVNPTLPLTAELVRRGHTVVYHATEEFREKIRRTGADFRSYGSPVGGGSRPESNLVRVACLLLETTLEILPGALDAVRRERPDYVIHDALCPWGRYAAELAGVPAICSTPTFALHPRLLRSPSVRRSLALEIAGSGAALWRFRRAARRLADAWDLRRPSVLAVLTNPAELNLVYTSRRLQPRADLFDDSYRFVGPSVASRVEERDPELPRSPDGALVYVSLGTLYNERPDFYRTCMRAFGGSGLRVVMSVGRRVERAALGPPPDNFVVREHAPQLQVLETARLFVTHAGMNSVAEGLWHGVPLLLFPQTAEQAFVADRVEKLGAGRRLRARRPRASELRELAREVLERAAYREAALELGRSLREAGGHVRAADEVVTYARAKNEGRRVARGGLLQEWLPGPDSNQRQGG